MVQPVTVPNYITANVRVGYRIIPYATVSLLAEQSNQHGIDETADCSLTDASSPTLM
jgi:hypothetical protein